MENILLDQVLQQVQNKEISIEKARELICVLFNVSNCYECNKPYDDKDREHGMCHKCWQPIIEE